MIFAERFLLRSRGFAKPENVQVHTEYMGGGFGRRAQPDYIGEAVEVGVVT